MEKPYVAGIDIGGQTSKIGIVDARGTVLTQTTIRTDTHTDVNDYISDLCDALTRMALEVGGIEKIRGIGVGAPNGTIIQVQSKWQSISYGAATVQYHLQN